MPKHRIKQLRTERNMTLDDLAEKVGRSRSAFSRIESGESGLDIDMAYKVAEALGATVEDVLGFEATNGGFEEDGSRYQAEASDPFKAFEGPHTYLFKVTTNLLDLAGVPPGSTVVINDSAEACRAVTSLQIVAVQYHPTSNGKTMFLLRQFLPPRLLITNSSKLNLRSIDLSTESATIVGVVKHVLRSMN